MKPFGEAGLHERAAYEAGGAQRQTLKKLNVTQSDCRHEAAVHETGLHGEAS